MTGHQTELQHITSGNNANCMLDGNLQIHSKPHKEYQGDGCKHGCVGQRLLKNEYESALHKRDKEYL
jgi:hypothetical protein